LSERVVNSTTVNPTVTGGFVAAILRALDARGVDHSRVLEAAGIDGAPSNDPMLRIPVARLHKLYDVAVTETGDPLFGMHAARFLRAGNLHAFGFSLLASNSLRDFGARLSRYFQFVSAATEMILVVEPPHARLEFEFLGRHRAKTWSGSSSSASFARYRMTKSIR
jgi:hypothetical protein